MAERICSIEDCERVVIARGRCSTHYGIWWRANRSITARPSMEERFWAKIQKTGTCWLWTGNKNNQGYGEFWVASAGKKVLAHRFAYTLLVGPIPEGHEVDHVKANGCTSALCVKAVADEHGPAHLGPVTPEENKRRTRRTHCPAGHPYDEANSYIRRQGHPECRACHRVQERKRWRRVKEGR